MMFALGVLVALQATASTAPPERDVLVIGQSLDTLQGSLARCIARGCPPDQEISAALAVAEHQFVDGAYNDAQATLRTSIRRNRRYAKAQPIPVSDLLRASGRIAEHRGATGAYKSDTRDGVAVLRAALPASDPRVLAAGVEIGDMCVELNDIDGALNQYRKMAQQARELKVPFVDAMSRLRIVSLYAALSVQSIDNRRNYTQQAEAFAKSLAAERDPVYARFAKAADVLVASAAARNGDASAVDRIIAAMGDTATTQPQLAYQPRLRGFSDTYDGSPAWNAVQRTIGQWVDIGFRIQSDGRVADAAVLRGGTGEISGVRTVDKSFDPAWTSGIVEQIAGRRYMPSTGLAEQPASVRVERYTLTRRTVMSIGSRIEVTDPRPQLVRLDLTPVAANTELAGAQRESSLAQP